MVDEARLNRYLAVCNEVVAASRTIIDKGNRLGGLASTDRAIAAVNRLRADAKANTEAAKRPFTIAGIAHYARLAEQYHAGNCHEYASWCFTELRKRMIEPLDFMTVRDGDHTFVVVGRADGTTASDFTTWNAEAVVCDAWGMGVYRPTRLNMLYGLPTGRALQTASPIAAYVLQPLDFQHLLRFPER